MPPSGRQLHSDTHTHTHILSHFTLLERIPHTHTHAITYAVQTVCTLSLMMHSNYTETVAVCVQIRGLRMEMSLGLRSLIYLMDDYVKSHPSRLFVAEQRSHC